jgi:hypothetical protein
VGISQYAYFSDNHYTLIHFCFHKHCHLHHLILKVFFKIIRILPWPEIQVGNPGQKSGSEIQVGKPCPAALPGRIARQHCPAALPSSIARQPCPAALPGSIARQHCPAALPGSIARQLCPAAFPGSIVRIFSLVLFFKCIKKCILTRLKYVYLVLTRE